MAFNPKQPFKLIDPPAFDPSSPFEELPDERGHAKWGAKNLAGLAGRGALDQGAGSIAEGLLRVADTAFRGAKSKLAAPDLLQQKGILEFLEAGERAEQKGRRAIDPERQNRIAQTRQRIADLTPASAPRLAEIAAAPGLKPAAAKVGEFRQAVRDVYPVDEDVQQSIPGQVIQGVFQAGAGMAAYLTGLGIPASVGQMFDQSYSEALASGADSETAISAGLGNIPAAALEQLGDKFQLGGLVKALRGTGKKGIKEIGKQGLNAFAGEAATETLQQGHQNVVAKTLYDADREITEGAGTAALVGGLTGATVAVGGTALGQGLAALDTGRNVPEGEKTLRAQQEQLRAGRRPAQMFPLDAEGKATNELPLPEGMARVANERGVFHYDPQQITADQLLSLSAKGRENEILGLGPISKPEVDAAAKKTGAPVFTVTERAPDGTEIKAAVATASTAEATARALEKAKTPGNTVQAEATETTLAGRTGKTSGATPPAPAPGFLDEILNRDAALLAERRATAEKETADRLLRQVALDKKKDRVLDALATAEQTLADPAAPFAAVAGALRSVTYYVEDNAVGITQDQRNAARRAQAALGKRQAALAPAEQLRTDALEVQGKLRADAEALAAKQKLAQGKAEFRAAEKSGLGADGATDYGALSVDQLAERAQAGDKKAERAMIERESGQDDDRPGLLAVLARVKLPESDPVFAGELRALREGMTPQQQRLYFRKGETSGLDSIAEVLRADHGFSQFQSTNDVFDFIGRALRGEDIRADRGAQGQVDFATRKPARPRKIAEPEPAPRTDFRDAEEQRAYLADDSNFDGWPGIPPNTPLWHLSQQTNRLSAELQAEKAGRKLTFAKVDDAAERATGKKWRDFTSAEDYQATLAEIRQPGSQTGKYTGGQTELEFARRKAAEEAAATRPGPPETPEAIAREWTALVRAFPRLADLFKMRIGNIQAEFTEAGYRGQVPSGVEAAVWEQKRLIVIAARAWRDRKNGAALLAHEVAHLYWETLPTDAKDQLRALHAHETGTKTGPLYDEQGFMRGSIQFERDRLPVARVASDPDLPIKEWFAERIALLNRDWAEGKIERADRSLPMRVKDALRALWRVASDLRELRRQIVGVFAQASGIDPDSELFEKQFRAFITAGADRQLGRQAGAAYAQRKAEFAAKPEFAAQAAFDLDTPRGIDLPNEVRNLIPRWQDKSLRFASSLDKALYYAGAAGRTELHERITQSVAEQTGLSTGQVASLARTLRQRIANLVISAANDGTVRVPATMREEAARLTGVEFAAASDADPSQYRQAELEISGISWDARLKAVESELAGLAESQEDPEDLEARGRALTTERDQLRRQITDAAREAQAARLIADVRHPAAVGVPEPGDAWAMVPKMTDAELRAERDKIAEHLADELFPLAQIERVNLRGRIDAIRAEENRRIPSAGRTAEGANLVPALPNRRTALLAELARGRAMSRESHAAGNDAGQKESVRIVQRARETLDNEFPGWETTARPTTAQAPSAIPPPPRPPRPPVDTTESAQPDDAERSPFIGTADAPEPIRPGKIAEIYGQSSYQPGVVARSWRQVREALVGIRGPVPELPTFPASASNRADPFIAREGARFYNGIREFYRALKSGNDYVQRTAQEQVARITRPLIEAGGSFDANAYARLQKRQETARQIRADKKTVPPAMLAEIAALQSEMESNPYVLFNRLVLQLDLKWRHENLEDSAGNPIRLPSSLNRTEVASELTRIGNLIQAGPHAALIRNALNQHMALVKDVAAGLQSRELMAAEQLANPYYFPHLTLQIERGGKTEQRELTPERVRPGTEADFRGYLQAPVGSTKPIETDYVRALYFHLVQVGAHNLKADAIKDHARPYDVMAKVRERAAALGKARGSPVSWEQAFHEEFAPAGYVLYGTDSRDAFPTISVDRDKLARRLGVMLTSADLHAQLDQLGLDGVRLLPNDLRETLAQGARETWVIPARVAEALRGIADRETRTTSAMETAMTNTLRAWKAWKLFMPWSHIRYEYGNITSDLEKIVSATPGTFKTMPAAAREIRAFWIGGAPSADLRAAIKEGAINAITAQEMGKLTGQQEFKEFETTAQKLWAEVKAAGSSPLLNATRIFSANGVLGRLTSPELSAYREAVFRYANFKNNLEKIRAGERPDYGGAYYRDIDAMQDSRPGAADRAERQAAQISKATFGDYGDLSVLGQGVRDKLIPFYSWIEVNFRYHANLLRNLRDMVRANELSRAEAAKAGTRAAAAFAAGFTARAAGGMMLRLALPYVAVALWNTLGENDEIEKELSAEDRRRFHIILGRDEDGKPNIIYAPGALADVIKWFSGPLFAQQAGAYLQGKTDFRTAFAGWRDQIVPDFLNNTLGSFGPYFKIPLLVLTGKNAFPDVTDMRSVPAYDMRRVILGQIFDDFTANQVEKVMNKDYYAGRDWQTWIKQLVFQVRVRDPEQWASFEIKDKAATFEARATGKKRSIDYDAPDQQVLRNFRRAIYRGDVEQATTSYQRLLELGYTADRFKASIRSQAPLAGLPKELRAPFVASLTPDERVLLDRAGRHYERMHSERGQERGLFPSERSGDAGQARYLANPQIERLRRNMEAVGQLNDDELMLRADRTLRESLRR